MNMTGKNINLTDQLKKYFGFDTFKGNQQAIIENLLAGNDTFVLMPTGGGKSLCYQLPSLLMEGTAIVISPLIALMKNQVDAMRNYSEEDGVAHFINSSLSKSAIEQVKADIVSGKTKLLYVAPESLTKEENVEFLRTVKISFYAVDEAHCISEWGHDFRPEYRRIRPIINEIGKAPLIALTATATPKVQHDIQKNLGMVDAKVFKSSFNRPNLYYEVRAKTANIDKDIIKFIRANPEKSGIIYCLSRKKVEELAEILQANGINARPYHAGMDSATRTQNQDDFLMERIDVIVATIAFGMGIDKPDVRYVIHYDMPKSLEGYYQETGRAGRDGQPATVHLLYGRGVEDNQQGLVSMLLLAEALHATGLTPELTLGLVFMADEETGNTFGLAHILAAAPELFRQDDLFIVPDSGSPSGADIEVAEKSIAQFKVHTRGLQGHASTPHKARNALTAAAAAITSLSELGRDFPQEDPLFDPPCSTFVPTRHDANGPGINIIPGEDVFYLDCRLLPGIDPDAVLAATRQRVAPIARHHGTDIDVELVHLQKASASAPNCPAARALVAAVQEIYGVEARPTGIGGGTVAALLRQAGLPAVVWSCIRNTCHQHNEHSSISATIRDAQVFAHVLMQCR